MHPTTLQAQTLSEAEWERVDQSVDRALDWVVSTQWRDGSYPTFQNGQPGVTSLAILALLSNGEQPGQSERGESISKALDYVLATQKPNGLLAFIGPYQSPIPHEHVEHNTGQTGAYNHAISALMLSELYGSTSPAKAEEVRKAIELALKLTLTEQQRPKRRIQDEGGWRYLDNYGYHEHEEADLSVIGWQLKFLRSAKNAGFDVPKKVIDDAVRCVRNHFDPSQNEYSYSPQFKDFSRAMTGAGILAMAHSGLHDTSEAQHAGAKMLKYRFTNYNDTGRRLDRYHYSAFQCTQAAFQLGNEYWEEFSPPVFRTLLAKQNPDGSWSAEHSTHGDRKYGRIYTTSLMVLCLNAPNQFLPIYQR